MQKTSCGTLQQNYILAPGCFLTPVFNVLMNYHDNSATTATPDIIDLFKTKTKSPMNIQLINSC